MYLATLWFTAAFLAHRSSGAVQKSVFGGEDLGFLRELVFDVIARQEMECFNDFFAQNATVHIFLRTVNVQGQKIQMRVTSPSGEFSEWYEGIDQISYPVTVAAESGAYEICVTTRAQTGQFVRLSLIIHMQDLEKMSFVTEQFREQEESEETIKKTLYNLMKSMISSKVTLQQLNSYTFRDMHLQIKNAKYIDTFSLIQTIVMICAAGTQVYVIRKLFMVDPRKIRI